MKCDRTTATKTGRVRTKCRNAKSADCVKVLTTNRLVWFRGYAEPGVYRALLQRLKTTTNRDARQGQDSGSACIRPQLTTAQQRAIHRGMPAFASPRHCTQTIPGRPIQN